MYTRTVHGVRDELLSVAMKRQDPSPYMNRNATALLLIPFRLSGVRCPSVADVPAPTASTPLQHVEEISPFARPAATSGAGRKASGNASSAPEKPKGKAIDPKDFFSVSASAGGEAGAKGAKGKGKGKGAEKPAPKKEGGGISSFFGKGNSAFCYGSVSRDRLKIYLYFPWSIEVIDILRVTINTESFRVVVAISC